MHNAVNLMLNISQAAKIIGVHPNTLRAWGDSGILPFPVYYVGPRRDRRYRIEDIKRYLETCECVGNPRDTSRNRRKKGATEIAG